MSLLVNQIYKKVFGTREGVYGLGIFQYVPGGPMLEHGIDTIESIYKTTGQDKGWSGALARVLHGFGDFYIPFYHLANRGIGTATDQEYFKLPVEVDRQIKEFIAEKSGSRAPADMRKWSERDLIQKFQYFVLGGSWSAQKEELMQLYAEYVDEADPDKRQKLSDKIEENLRRYPASTKRKEYERKVENIEEIVPGVEDAIEKPPPSSSSRSGYRPTQYKRKEYRPYQPGRRSSTSR